jgi:hypothetical protein
MQVNRHANRKGHARSDSHADPQRRKSAVGGSEPIDDYERRGGSRQAQDCGHRRCRQSQGTTQAYGHRRCRRKCGKHNGPKDRRPGCYAAIPQVG